MNFLEHVREKRRKLKDVLFDDEYSGIREFLEELYPDNAHFIYELLQNAEDAAATKVLFSLTNEKLIFEHNGRPFDEDDITAITNIGKGTKKNDPDKIGKFGIGFKAVFGYTETPKIWSPKHSFELRELIMPYELGRLSELGKKTRFEFPFDSEKKSAEQAFSEIDACLREISPATLLFLKNIKRLSCEFDSGARIDLERKEIDENHIQIIKKSEKTRTCSEFLRFTAPVKDLKKQFVAIAFELEKVKATKKNKKGKVALNYKIVPAQPGKVAIFFPAKKEISGLRFHLHAPFVPELSRASIKDTSVNKTLYEQLGKLAANSLPTICKLGLLTGEFLGVLPNLKDQIAYNYQIIRSAIQNEFKNKALVPTQCGSYAEAKRLIQAGASYKKVFSKNDLQAFFPEKTDQLAWAIAATQKSSNADRFLSDLGFEELTSKKVFSKLKNCLDDSGYYTFYTDSDKRFQAWFYSKPKNWYQIFYAFLNKEFEREIGWGYFSKLRLVCLQNNTFSTPSRAYFPGSDGLHDSLFPRVDPACFNSGKDEDEKKKSKTFLAAIGVKKIGETEYVKAILEANYSQDEIEVAELEHFKHIEKFAEFLSSNSNQAKLFTQYEFLKSDEDTWERPENLYIDSPFEETFLKAYYERIEEDSLNKRKAISREYFNSKLPPEKLVGFFKKIGLVSELVFEKVSCSNNPFWDNLKAVGGRRDRRSCFDNDYKISELEDLLMEPSLELSKLVWKTMCSAEETFLKAAYQNNFSKGSKSADSSIICLLKDACWVPQSDGTFVAPAKARFDKLPGGFPVDKSQDWLKAVNFGFEYENQKDCPIKFAVKKLIYARELGFESIEKLDRAKALLDLLTFEEQEKILNKNRSILPNREPANPQLRSERVFEAACSAFGREKEQRLRTVDIHQHEVKSETKEYLRQYYTNEDGQMIC